MALPIVNENIRDVVISEFGRERTIVGKTLLTMMRENPIVGRYVWNYCQALLDEGREDDVESSLVGMCAIYRMLYSQDETDKMKNEFYGSQ